LVGDDGLNSGLMNY